MSQALVPHSLVSPRVGRRTLQLTAAWIVGVASLAALARISIPLPGTPVPMTGQTFGVALIALVSGRRLGSAIVATYLAAGILGAPIFSHGSSFVTGATAGYLVGMCLASVVIGGLADLGWGRTWGRAFTASYLGSLVVFTAGVIGLRGYVPPEHLLGAGAYPFLLGDFLKNVAAATLARAAAPPSP